MALVVTLYALYTFNKLATDLHIFVGFLCCTYLPFEACGGGDKAGLAVYFIRG